MAIRQKRSISLPPRLARAIDEAAARQKTTFSAWLADSAERRLKLEAGRRVVAEWEREHGPFTAEELEDARASAARLLGHTPRRRGRRST